jgi:hypothetical protein
MVARFDATSKLRHRRSARILLRNPALRVLVCVVARGRVRARARLRACTWSCSCSCSCYPRPRWEWDDGFVHPRRCPMRQPRVSAPVVRALLAVVGFVVSAVCFSACSCEEDTAATSACHRTAGSTACKACCGMHGRHISSNWNGCTCYR